MARRSISTSGYKTELQSHLRGVMKAEGIDLSWENEVTFAKMKKRKGPLILNSIYSSHPLVLKKRLLVYDDRTNDDSVHFIAAHTALREFVEILPRIQRGRDRIEDRQYKLEKTQHEY
ncbi:unnamed protein product [Ceratitis capitata]|uniref:(Mediterranean fruit fly) hypothetical protein n=1 Tax=Ceratitis capitata TaxID=7213 RepID=A0A811VBU2_CERCA|nr:unnamed protein product [Ceratitis capitata]